MPVTEPPDTVSPPASDPAVPAPARRTAVLPGLILSLAIGAAAVGVSTLVPAASAALIAIVLGALGANLRALPAALKPGLDLSAKTVLRIGIVLLGLQLALGDVIALGPATLLVIVAVVGLGIGGGLLLGRLLRLPRDLTILISCGFSICGAAAVAAVSGALGGREDEEATERLETRTATAVALVVVFGTLMIPLLPLAARLLDLDAAVAGTWAGASIHEVAQVVAAGSILGGPALDAAVLVKLGRVLLLAPVIALLALSLRSGGRGDATARGKRPPLVPLFVIGFLAAVLLRSIGIVPLPVLDAAQLLQAVLLAAAMFALGTGVRISLLRQVGGRPVVLAVLLTLLVAAIGLAGAMLAR
ncbi:YeiH family protein [Brachybacterium hainanense]|uniref:YeiH family protein n=1 Tax=Brachybacterium hainanense TaxID=1541174 RepID=A0ABV6RA07_9MICO